jgi:hypothetical protein
MAQEFLDALFGTQTAFRPKDAFGFDGMRRLNVALAPPAPFQLESFLFDTSLAPVVRELNAVIREFEAFRGPITTESNELAKLEHAVTPSPGDRDRRRELTRSRDVLFVKQFDELHAKGMLYDHKTSNEAAVDALQKALAVYPAEDPKRAWLEDVARRLRDVAKRFDGVVDAAIKTMSRPQPAKELVYRVGDTLFLFFKGTGSLTPKLHLTFRIRRVGSLSETRDTAIEQPFGVLTRAFDDPPEINRQQNFLFAVNDQTHWVSLFTQPLLMADPSAAPGVERGIVANHALLGEVPGNYIASIELFDDSTGSSTKTDIEFTVVPNRTVRSHQGLDSSVRTGMK